MIRPEIKIAIGRYPITMIVNIITAKHSATQANVIKNRRVLSFCVFSFLIICSLKLSIDTFLRIVNTMSPQFLAVTDKCSLL